MKTHLGNYLRSAVAAGVTTKSELGQAAGITASTVGQIIRGEIKRPPEAAPGGVRPGAPRPGRAAGGGW